MFTHDGPLVRKPGAFARYRFREELFPSLTFRAAYDALGRTHGERADVEYVRLLHLAAMTGERLVEATLRARLDADVPCDYAGVQAQVRPPVPTVPGGPRAPPGSGAVRRVADRRSAPMTAPSTQVTTLLTQFGLTTAAEELVPRLTQAGCPEAMPVLLEVFEAEAEARRQRRITRLRRASRLPPGKTFATLDTGRLPGPVVQQLETLATGAFLETATNVLAFGLPGVGKSHALSAVGHALVEAGHSVLCAPAYALVQELLGAKRDIDLPRALRKLDLFEASYERRSVMVTSNLVFSQWDRIFRDQMATAAAIDRLVHHAVVIEFDVPSYRTDRSRPKSPLAPAPRGRAPGPLFAPSPPTLDVVNVRAPSRLSPVRYVTVWSSRGIDERGAAGALPGAAEGRRVPDPVPPAGGPEAATAVERRGADAPGAAGPVPGVAGRVAGIPRRVRDRGVTRAGLRTGSVGTGGCRAAQGLRA